MAAKRYKKGFFIGRFQPFHLGHKYALEFVEPHVDELIIGIGSSNEAGTPLNPLDTAARMEIIKEGLKDTKIDMRKVRFIEVPDFNNDEDWFNYIKGRHSDIEVVFSGNQWVQDIFKSKGMDVVVPPELRRDELSGTNVRLLINDNEKWEHLVPARAVDTLKRHRGRIKGHPTAAAKGK